MFSCRRPLSRLVESQSFRRPGYRVFLALFVLFLLVSMHGVTWTPFYTYRGLDFQNLHAYFHGYADPLGRPMVYPPPMIWMMSWCRGIPYYAANLYWEFAIVMLTFLGTWIVSTFDRRRSAFSWMVWALLLFQLPMVYAVERGNNDAWVIPVFTLASALVLHRKIFTAGLFFAAACWLKVYPVVPCVLLLAIFVLDPELRRRYFWKLLAGLGVGGVGIGLIFWPESWTYVTETLPAYAKEHRLLIVSSHSLFRRWPSLFLKVPILLLWGTMFHRMFRKDPLFVFTAGLAISTFFQDSSNDYSLITAYPFLFVLMNRMLKPGIDWRRFGWLVFSFWVFIGDRTPVAWLFHSRGAIFVHVIWFLTFPFFMKRELDEVMWSPYSFSYPADSVRVSAPAGGPSAGGLDRQAVV
ncbi:MAG: DUF2029 domain-containing protein [Cryobacterium sp.]|nr:DUF2029 domain-containing protein [Oligoflexia bacterium]